MRNYRTFTHQICFLCFLLLSCLWGKVSYAEAPWYDGQWAHEKSDLPADTSIVYGQLANGFRYAIIPHSFPQGRVSMMLNVQAGSLMEADNELGYAHFVEHMAFNGSKNFKPGELIPFFQKHGMSFGGDTNAHTSFTETVYKLNLADTTAESMSMGAKVLRDFADGVLFSENEVQDELGVILSEKRSRDNESARAGRKKREILFAGTRFVHDIIGTEETLQAVSGAKLQAFYDRWYRPERMMLVMVGEVDITTSKQLIAETFSDMVGRGEAVPVANWGEAKSSGLRMVYQEREHDAITIALQTIHSRRYVPDSQERLYASLVDSIAEFCMQQRLDTLREAQPDVWLQGVYQNWSKDAMFPLTSLTAVTTQEKWKETLTALSDELRSALQYGFSHEEISFALEQFALNIKGAAQARKRMPSDALNLTFITATNSGRVFTSENYDSEFFADFAKRVTLDEINTAFKASFLPENLTVYVTGPAKLLTEQDILQAYKEAQKRPVKEMSFTVPTAFPYLPLPPVRLELPQLSQKLLTEDGEGPKVFSGSLNNGIQLKILHYPIEEGRIRASIFFGSGRLGYEDSQSPTIDMLNATLGTGGVGKLDSQESLLLFGYRDMRIQEQLSSSHSLISGAGRSEDLELLLQALWTQYKDPVIREKDRMLVVRGSELQQRIKDTTVDGVSQSQSRRFFYGDALRYSDLSYDMAKKVSLADMQKLLAESRITSPLTIVVGGDVDVEQCVRVLTQLFEPESFIRKDISVPLRATQPIFPTHEKFVIEVAEDPVEKAIMRVGIHSDLREDARRELATRQLLAAVLADRLREELREKQGIVYGASVWYSLLSDTMDKTGYGLLNLALVTAKKEVDKAQKTIQAEMQRLMDTPITNDELERIRKPLLTSWTTDRKTLGKWYGLLQAEQVRAYPYIDWYNGYKNLLESVSANDLQKDAQRLFREKSASLVIYSQGKKEPLP